MVKTTLAFDHHMLNELARIGQVPEDRISFLYRKVAFTIEIAIEAHYRPSILAEKRIKPALTLVAKRAQALDEALANLNEGARIRLASARPLLKTRTRGIVHSSYSDFEVAVSALAEMAEQARKQMEAKSPGRRGRPPGSNKNWPFQLFVQRLLTDVEVEAKGKLTLYGLKQAGSLVDALRLLTPCLPEGFIPNALPYDTLKKILASCRKYRENRNK